MYIASLGLLYAVTSIIQRVNLDGRTNFLTLGSGSSTRTVDFDYRYHRGIITKLSDYSTFEIVLF